MATITTSAGKELHTEHLPECLSPANCARCGCRAGWYHEDFTDRPIMFCDDCAADMNADDDPLDF